jgi:hypothetical protein
MHIGSCRKLYQALLHLWPENFSNTFEIHREGNECFELMIETLVQKAVVESNNAQEYAEVCKKTSELFETIHVKNPFKFYLNNHLQKWFTTIR